MATGKYKEWLETDKLILLEGWARDGLTDKQIAKNIGIAESTLNEWKKKYSEFSKSLKKGKEVIDFEVENALLKNALKGDTTAQIFWLKNRKSKQWRDSRDRTDKQDKLMEAQIVKAEFDAELSKLKAESLKNGTTQTTEDKLDKLFDKISGELDD